MPPPPRPHLSQAQASFAVTQKKAVWGAQGAAALWRDGNTHIQLEGLQHCPVPPRDGGEEAKHFLDDAVQVVKAVDVVKPEGALADAAVVEDAFAAQLLPQLPQHLRMFEELHDQRGAGTGRGGIGSKDELQSAILKDKSKARLRHKGWTDRPAAMAYQGTGTQLAVGHGIPVTSNCKGSLCAGTGPGY